MINHVHIYHSRKREEKRKANKIGWFVKIIVSLWRSTRKWDKYYNWPMKNCFLSYLNLESKNDCPDEAEDHPGVPVDDILRADVLQPNLSQRIRPWTSAHGS